MARYSPGSREQLFCWFILLCKGILCIDHVPMLIWSTDRSLQGLATTLHEGQVISEHELHTFLQHPISQASRNIVLFLQDTLSVDDFTRYADSSGNETPFRNVQELLKTSSSSLVLPTVDCHAVSQLSDYFQKNLYWIVMNVDDLDISQLMGNASKPRVFEKNLQPIMRINEPSTRKALMDNDKIIGRFAKALQQQGSQSLAIYTARQPSRVPVESSAAWYNRRQLLAVENQENNELYSPLKIDNGTHTCILFYATNFSLTLNKSIPINLMNLTFVSRDVNTMSSDCQNTTNAILSLHYTNPVNSIKNLEIRFIMSNKYHEGSARNWFTLDHVWILQDNRNISKFTVSKISSPVEYSFHCQLVGTSSLYGATLIPASAEAEHWDIVISEFQIQAFSVGNGTFSYASDCTTFFTPAIWMSLVTSLILLLILTYGIHMVVHLTTNSRFDDPKSPALSLPQTE